MKPHSSELSSERAGWTFVEVAMAVTMVVLVMGKAALVMQSALGLASDQTATMHQEDQARRVIDRIALAIMGSDRDTLLPQVEDVHSTSIRYNCSLGLENGVVVWGEPEEVRLNDDGDSVEWRENPGTIDERQVVWTSLVSPLLEGETVNGVDDNGNGLIDEDGLSFVVEGERVIVRLTIQRREVDGRTVQQTVESIVACRN